MTDSIEEPRGVERWLAVRWEVRTYLLLLVTALTMRLWDLGSRAMHHDESMHALYSWFLADGRGYQHNPLMHGPFQFHANALNFFFLGDSEFTARLLYVLFGTALVATPFFLRYWIGRSGALITAVLLAFSPTLFYFSRFARNDILMAVWAVALIICIWRYLEKEQDRYIYLLSAFLALAFATKETSYITIGVLGLFLLILSKAWRFWERPWPRSPEYSALFIVMLTLSLPQGSALVALLQGPLGLVLSNSDWTLGPIGVPMGADGIAVAVGVTAFALLVSAALGLLWDWRRWLLCAGIFYSIWIILYTSVFTNSAGLATGMWQGLGYWIAQQDVARGGQPWFYYQVVGWTYEFVPFLVGVAGAAWYARGGDLFGRFLVFWSAATFLLFTFAGEKMPWLLVHVTLPLIILAGRALGELVERVPWQRMVRADVLGGVAMIPLLFLFSYRLLFYEAVESSLVNFFSLWGWFLLVFGLLGLILYLTTRQGWRPGLSLVGLALVAVLFLLSVRAGWRASYENGDVPTEMLVYTQTSPDIPQIVRDLQRIGEGTGQGTSLPVSIDGDDGFGWPWYWYLREQEQVSYLSYSQPNSPSAPNAEVLILNAGNETWAQETLDGEFVQVRRFRHRWWFPEGYREITLKRFFTGITDRSAWHTGIDYWLFRKLDTPLGSADAYLYYAQNLSRGVPFP